jgi:hypothetical protein
MKTLTPSGEIRKFRKRKQLKLYALANTDTLERTVKFADMRKMHNGKFHNNVCTSLNTTRVTKPRRDVTGGGFNTHA